MSNKKPTPKTSSTPARTQPKPPASQVTISLNLILNKGNNNPKK